MQVRTLSLTPCHLFSGPHNFYLKVSSKTLQQQVRIAVVPTCNSQKVVTVVVFVELRYEKESW